MLDEAVMLGDLELIRSIYVKLQQIMWRGWLSKRSATIQALSTIPDFYCEFSWCFKSKGGSLFTSLIQSIAPQDTYKIWKKGSKLRMDSTIVGLSSSSSSSPSASNKGGQNPKKKKKGPFGIIRGNVSLIFNPKNSLNTNDDDEDGGGDIVEGSHKEEEEEETVPTTHSTSISSSLQRYESLDDNEMTNNTNSNHMDNLHLELVDELVILDREKFTVNTILEKLANPSEIQIQRAMKRLKRASKQTLHSFSFQSQNFSFHPKYERQSTRERMKSSLRFGSKAKKRKKNDNEGGQEIEGEKEIENEEETSQNPSKIIKTKIIGEQEWNCEKYEANIDLNATLFQKEGIHVKNKNKKEQKKKRKKRTSKDDENEELDAFHGPISLSFEEYFSSQQEFIQNHDTKLAQSTQPSSSDSESKTHETQVEDMLLNDEENRDENVKDEDDEDQSTPSNTKEYSKTLTASIYLCPSFPITLDQLLPALEVFALNWKIGSYLFLCPYVMCVCVFSNIFFRL